MLFLAENGADLCDVNFEKLTSVKKETEEFTKDVLIYDCDVSDEEKVYSIIKNAEEQFGGIDILVNNAALWRSWSTFVDTPTDDWRKFIDINVMGVVYATKAV